MYGMEGGGVRRPPLLNSWAIHTNQRLSYPPLCCLLARLASLLPCASTEALRALLQHSSTCQLGAQCSNAPENYCSRPGAFHSLSSIPFSQPSLMDNQGLAPSKLAYLKGG